MKGLEQRHSQLPNAWTRPQGPRTHRLLLLTHTPKHTPHLRIHGEGAVEGITGNCVYVCGWVVVHMREGGDLLNCCHF